MTGQIHVYLRCALAVLVMLGGLAGCDARENGATVMTVGSNLPADHPSSQAIEVFRKRLEEESGGKLQVRAFYNSQLGSQSEMVESTQGGNVQAVFASVATIANYVPSLNAMSLPFLFRDREHAFRVLDGEVGQRIEKDMAEVNLHTLSWFDAGARSMMTKRGPVRTPEDMKGMKIRVIPGQIMVAFIDAIGASPVAMDQGEVYTALQMGMLDGWENNPPTAVSFKMWETGVTHFARTEHLQLPDMLLVNKAFYEGLPEDLRRAVDKVAEETKHKQRELWKRSEEESIERMKAAGMQFNDVRREAFAGRVEPVYQAAYERYGPEFRSLVEQIRSTP